MSLETIILWWLYPFILLIAYAAWRDRSAPLLPHSVEFSRMPPSGGRVWSCPSSVPFNPYTKG